MNPTINKDAVSGARQSEFEYSPEDVAHIAARFLKGEHPNHYQNAARRAVTLLDTCREELKDRKRRKEILDETSLQHKEWNDKYNPASDGKIVNMPWREALEHITGNKVESRALPLFKKFYTHYW